MSTQTLVKRVEALERQMSEMSTLPARVEELSTQLWQFRVEVREEFSAVRAEIADLRAELRAEVGSLRGEGKNLRTEFDAFRVEVAERFDTLASTLRAEIRSGDEETRHQMRALHEDLVGRIALLQEGLRPRNRRRQGRAKPTRSKKGSG
jgi:hypothetical protein